MTNMPEVTATCDECGYAMSPSHTVSYVLMWHCEMCGTDFTESFSEMDDDCWEWVKQHMRRSQDASWRKTDD